MGASSAGQDLADLGHVSQTGLHTYAYTFVWWTNISLRQHDILRMPSLTIGRSLLLLANLATAMGSYIADWSPSHLLNPNWPPHAKFHNGQTMSLAALLSLVSTYIAFRSPAGKTSPAAQRQATFDATVIGSLYCFAGLLAILYPGTEWNDPEFPGNGEQRWVFGGIIAVLWVGYALELRRLHALEMGRKAQ